MILLSLNKIKILSFLSCAVVPLLVTGPFLPDLFLSSLSLWFLYYVFKNKLFYVFKNKFFYFFIVFCLFCIFSSLMSERVYFSLKSSLFYFRIGIFCIFISYLIRENKNFLNYFFYTLVVTFSIVIVYAYIQYFFNLQIHPIRVSSLFGEELILGSFLSRLLPLIVALFIIRTKSKNIENYFFMVFLTLAYFCVILSGERSAFFYINLSLIFLLIFIKPKIKIFLISLFFLLTIAFIFMKSAENNRTGKLLIERFTSNVISSTRIMNIFKQEHSIEIHEEKIENSKKIKQEDKRIIIFTSGHESLYRTAFNMFLDKPIIGHGPRMFRVECSNPKYSETVGDVKSSCMTHPHNFYIQLLAETGIIGFSFLFSLFIYVVFLSIKYLYNSTVKNKKIYSDYNICILACLLITTWPIIPNGNFFNNYLMIIYSLPIGFFKQKFDV